MIEVRFPPALALEDVRSKRPTVLVAGDPAVHLDRAARVLGWLEQNDDDKYVFVPRPDATENGEPEVVFTAQATCDGIAPRPSPEEWLTAAAKVLAAVYAPAVRARVKYLNKYRRLASTEARPYWDGAIDAAQRKPPTSRTVSYALGYKVERKWKDDRFLREIEQQEKES